MIKKLLMMATCLLSLGVVTASAHMWENNPRYTNFQMHQQAVTAIDLDSIYVVKYAPPIYIIAGQQVMGTTYDSSAAHYGRFQWRYNYDTKIVEAYNNFTGGWYQLTGTSPEVIDKVFKKAYLISFYGPNPYAEKNKEAEAAKDESSKTVGVKTATQADIQAMVDATTRKTADKLDQEAAKHKDGKGQLLPNVPLPTLQLPGAKADKASTKTGVANKLGVDTKSTVTNISSAAADTTLNPDDPVPVKLVF